MIDQALVRRMGIAYQKWKSINQLLNQKRIQKVALKRYYRILIHNLFKFISFNYFFNLIFIISFILCCYYYFLICFHIYLLSFMQTDRAVHNKGQRLLKWKKGAFEKWKDYCKKISIHFRRDRKLKRFEFFCLILIYIVMITLK